MQDKAKPNVAQTETRPDAKREPVVIKKYANRRLYNTETSTYVTLDDLAGMVRSERDFVVYDAKSGEDLTHSVLTQIIVDQESRTNGVNLLPIGFLRQLIRFYGDSIEKMVPTYLEISLATLTREQERYRQQFASVFGSNNAFSSAAFDAMNEHVRKNLAMWEKAMTMWAPFAINPMTGVPAKTSAGDEAKSAEPVKGVAEIAELQAQMAAMQAKLDKLVQKGGG